MATVTAVKAYLKNAGGRSGFNVVLYFRDTSSYSNRPATSPLLASGVVAVETISSSGEWITFTLDSPVTIDETAFYGIQIFCNSTAYDGGGVYIYKASDWQDAYDADVAHGGDGDYTLTERGFYTDSTVHQGSDYQWAYELVGTDIDDNAAITVTADYELMFADNFGVRTYITPSGYDKATNPTPADDATEVDWSTPTLDWDGTGDTYDVYISTSTPFIASDLVAEEISASTYTLSTEQKNNFADCDSKLYWRVDSIKDGNTTSGDTWNFDPRPGQASSPTPVTTGTDIGLSQSLEWTVGTNADTVTVRITHPDTLEITELLTDSTDTSYDWSSDYLTWEKTFTWAVNSKNFYGTTNGTNWTFTTLNLDHLRISYNTIDGGSGPDDGGVEGVDFYYTGLNNVISVKRLVLIAKNRFYFES